MYRPLVDLIEDSIACAEVQLDAARRLDAARLREATERRQDLLFEIEAEGADRLRAETDEEVIELVQELRALDRRLERVLSSGVSVLRRAADAGRRAATYAPNGRIRGTTA